MYRSLLLQLLEGYPDLQTVLDDSELLTLSPQNKNVILSLDVLKDLLLKALPLLGRRSLICFIDALDECDEQQVRQMIEYFEELAERSTAERISFRICFSSRHYPYIITRWGTRLTLEHQPGHTQDLRAYICGKLRAQDPEVIEETLGKSAGVFMWVVLVVDILNREYARGAMSLRRKLQDLPAGLSDLFKDILKRDTENMEELLLCFLWILCAKRPLQPDEFCHALWSGLLPKGLVDTQIPRALVEFTRDGLPRSHRYIISCSKGLAEITRSSTPSVHFIHESVRDFLIKDKGLYELWPQLGLDWESPSHERLKECCNIYRNHEDVRAFIRKLPRKSKSSNCKETSVPIEVSLRLLVSYPFLEYANQNALYHENAAAKAIPQDIFLASLEVTSWVDVNNLFQMITTHEYTPKANLLYTLADKGYPELIRTRLKDFPDIHPFGERYRYPLFSALARGNKTSTAALLNLPSIFYDGVDITEGLNHREDLTIGPHRRPLSWAAENGKAVMLKLLVEHEDDFNAADRDGQTPLSLALKNRHVTSARVLIERGAPVDAMDEKGRTSLMVALANRDDMLAEMLFEQGADINITDHYGQTPLSFALQNRHDTLARILLERGAEINTIDQNEMTPLSLALKNGHENLARMLLERGAKINASDQAKWTPLSLALRNGHESLAITLIGQGAEFKTIDQDGRIPLSRASASGYGAIVKLLVERGANPSARDINGKMPLEWALMNDCETLAKLLHEASARP